VKCLQKDPRQRLRDAGDARLDIEKAMAETASSSSALIPVPEPRAPGSRWRWFPWTAAAGASLLAVFALTWRGAQSPPARNPVRLEMKLAADHPIQMLVNADSFIHISRDGRRVAYVGIDGETSRIFVRAMEGGPAVPIPGTEGGINPFLSPDGRWLAYLPAQGSALLKVPVEGGRGVPLAEAGAPMECSTEGPWGSDGCIYLTSAKPFMDRREGTLFRFSADGRNPEPLLSPDTGKGQRSVNFCQVLSGGALLIVINDADGEHVAAWKPGAPEVHPLVDGSVRAFYATPGYLIYKLGFSLMAVPMDLKDLKLTGKPVEIIDRILNPHVAEDGTLVYLSVDNVWPQTNLVRVDREGNYKPLTGNLGILWYPRVSPDGRRIAVQRTDPRTGLHVWIFDVERGVLARLATAPGPPHATFERQPVWSPDGDRVAYAFTAADRGPSSTLVRLLTVSNGTIRDLNMGPAFLLPESWSPDGRLLTGTFCEDPRLEAAREVWMLPVDDPKGAGPLFSGASIHRGSRLSPEGHWAAYFSDESGQFEVYVQSFPHPGQKWQVSTAGGKHPLWSADGRELFYLQGQQIMSVPVRLSPAFQPGTPAALCTVSVTRSDHETPWDVFPDGRHFVIVQEDKSQGPTQIGVVLNWFEEIRRKTAPAED
jgi:Tol biopolymer transport system component